MFTENYASSTIISTVSALSFVHKLMGMQDPGDNFLVKRVLQGCKKSRFSTDIRLPITPIILEQILAASTKTISDKFTRICFRAMCSLAFHALLRIGEMTESKNNLLYSNAQIQDDKIYLQFVNYKHSDGSSSLHTILPSPSSPICPVAHMQVYLNMRNRKSGPLFVNAKGTAVRSQQFNERLKTTLNFVGLDLSRYTAHSFRIGGATFLASQGASESMIQQAGRWSSGAFRSYIRLFRLG